MSGPRVDQAARSSGELAVMNQALRADIKRLHTINGALRAENNRLRRVNARLRERTLKAERHARELRARPWSYLPWKGFVS